MLPTCLFCQGRFYDSQISLSKELAKYVLKILLNVMRRGFTGGSKEFAFMAWQNIFHRRNNIFVKQPPKAKANSLNESSVPWSGRSKSMIFEEKEEKEKYVLGRKERKRKKQYSSFTSATTLLHCTVVVASVLFFFLRIFFYHTKVGTYCKTVERKRVRKHPW